MTNTKESPHKILLHACCGPCSLEPVRSLTERGVQPTIYYANSNIHPAEEYAHRLETLKEWAESDGVAVVEGAYDPDAWERTAGRVGEEGYAKFGVIADEHAAEYARAKAEERSESAIAAAAVAAIELGVGNTSEEARAARAARCRACYRLRFEEAAAWAAENGFETMGTTLSVSPYQHTRIIQEELERACENAGIMPMFEDYRPLYDAATERSRELGMYRQNSCGCRFSIEEAQAERDARKAARKAAKAAKRALAEQSQTKE